MKTFIFSTSFFLILIHLFLYGCQSKKQNSISNEITTESNILELNKKIKENPDNDSLYYNRANIFIENEQYDSAILDLKKALSIDSTHKPFYYHILSDVFLSNLESKFALRTLDFALRYFPNDEETILKSARLKLILQQHMSALATLDKIFIRDPQNTKALYLAGHIFYEMGDPGRAVNSYQKAVDLNPDFREAWIRLGDVLTELKNPKAITYYDNAIRMDSGDVETWHSKAYALHKLTKTNESLLVYREVRNRFPDYEPAYYNLGMIYHELDSIQEAIEQFTISINMNPAESSTYYRRGLSFKKAGDLVNAKLDFENALKYNHKFDEARNALKTLEK